MSAFELDLDLGGVNAFLNRLGNVADDAARPAAQAGAQVLYEEVRRNVSRIGVKPGNLRRSIYQFFEADRSRPGVSSYKVSWRKGRNSEKKAAAGVYFAPHGYLVEFGHLQRYALYVGKDGNVYTAVRKSMQGKPKPKRRASRAVKDAYYVPLPGGPKQVGARPFIRPAIARFPEALKAMEDRFFQEVARSLIK